ncbi:MAG: NINE protein, partial [Proteobacteria bacterium]|nr:NINE protein [Pseudomonadota bacterium]
MNDIQDICLKCGVKKNASHQYCHHCGEMLSPGTQFCLNCGVGVQKSSGGLEGEIGGQSKVVIILLCLFLGCWGVHNFVLGEVKKGVFKILMSFCFGISVFFVIYDLIKITVLLCVLIFLISYIQSYF